VQTYGGVFLNNYHHLKSRVSRPLLSYNTTQIQTVINPSISPSYYSESQKKLLQDPLLELHSECAKYYTSNIDSVIIYLNGYLYLLSGNNLVDKSMSDYLREETPARKPGYNKLKTMAHISANINIILLPYLTGKTLCGSYIPIALNKLSEYISGLKKSQGSDSIFDDTLKYIELLKDCKNKGEMEKVLREYNKLSLNKNMQLCKLSAKLQINGINKIISKWKSEGYLASGNTKIIIAGSQGPRKKLIEKQYFERQYGTESVTYVEMLPKQLLNVTPYDLLERLLEDEQNKTIGDYMFSNSEALFEDILGDHAKEPLEALSKCPFHRAIN